MRFAIAVLSIVACGSPTPSPAATAPAAPSDADFLAARAGVATRIVALFDAHDTAIAPDPEGAGPIPELDPAEFAAAGNVVLPVPTSKLTRCHVATVAALAGFAAIDGPALGEGKMGPGLTAEEKHIEIRRQITAATAAYCLWRDAAATCNAEAAEIPRFDPPHLACSAR